MRKRYIPLLALGVLAISIPAVAQTSTTTPTIFYENCSQAPGPIRFGEPGYRRILDGDNDGVACELDDNVVQSTTTVPTTTVLPAAEEIVVQPKLTG